MIVHSFVCGLGSELGSSSLGTLMKVQLDVGWACSSNMESSHGYKLMLAIVWELSWGYQMDCIHVVHVVGAFHSTVVILFRRPKVTSLTFLAP